MSLVIVQHGILLTVGLIPGRLSIVTDTLSRELDMMNGAQILESLSYVRRLFLANRALTLLCEVTRQPFLMPLPKA
jgi:hypothetical protein